MFTKTEIESKLDAEINSALVKLGEHDKTSKEYSVIVDHVVKLHKLKSDERLKPLSLDTALNVCVHIFGILRLTRYEREHVISSKALGFIPKLK